MDRDSMEDCSCGVNDAPLELMAGSNGSSNMCHHHMRSNNIEDNDTFANNSLE
jgi:hypothetical protein